MTPGEEDDDDNDDDDDDDDHDNDNDDECVTWGEEVIRRERTTNVLVWLTIMTNVN